MPVKNTKEPLSDIHNHIVDPLLSYVEGDFEKALIENLNDKQFKTLLDTFVSSIDNFRQSIISKKQTTAAIINMNVVKRNDEDN